jgi:hypothetical protein
MKSITFAWNAFWDNIGSQLALETAQRRSGVHLVEAIAADEFETQLRAITVSSEEREDLRLAALELAQLGVKRADLEPMARQWYTQPSRTLYELQTIKSYVQNRMTEQLKNEGTAS